MCVTEIPSVLAFRFSKEYFLWEEMASKSGLPFDDSLSYQMRSKWQGFRQDIMRGNTKDQVACLYPWFVFLLPHRGVIIEVRASIYVSYAEHGSPSERSIWGILKEPYWAFRTVDINPATVAQEGDPWKDRHGNKPYYQQRDLQATIMWPLHIMSIDNYR